MEKTPKTDEVINVVKQIATVLILAEYSINGILQADNKINETNKLIDAYKSNVALYQSCIITWKDVRNEYWEICPSVDDLSKYAKILTARFGNIEIPVDLRAYLLGGAINSKIWSIERQGFINKLQASDLCCMLDLMAGYLQMWVNGISHILEDMGINPISNEGPKRYKKKVIPKNLETNEAKEILQKAIEARLCDSNYFWKGTIQLLAYFADKTSHYLNLTKRTDKDGNIITLWKPFESLFEYQGKEYGKDKLKGAKQNWMRLNTKFEPTGYEEVDALFG